MYEIELILMTVGKQTPTYIGDLGLDIYDTFSF
jgi:hypothetical protein